MIQVGARVIFPLRNENNGFKQTFTAYSENNALGFPKFRFDFLPRIKEESLLLVSEWFVPSRSSPDGVTLIPRFFEAKGSYEANLTKSGLSTRLFLKRLHDHRVEQIDPDPLEVSYWEWCSIRMLLTETLARLLKIEELCMLTNPAQKQWFAYRNGIIWGSAVYLTPESWKKLIDEEGEIRDIQATTFELHNGVAQAEKQERSISITVRNEVWRRDNGRCVGCGSNERLEFDHIIPYSRGGSNTARNIQLLCESCNRGKGITIG